MVMLRKAAYHTVKKDTALQSAAYITINISYLTIESPHLVERGAVLSLLTTTRDDQVWSI